MYEKALDECIHWSRLLRQYLSCKFRTSRQVASCFIRRTYHMQTKRDSRRVHPTLAPKLYVEHVIIIALRPDRTSSHIITSSKTISTSIIYLPATASDSHGSLTPRWNGPWPHGPRRHGRLGAHVLHERKLHPTSLPAALYLSTAQLMNYQNRCSSPGTQPTSASSSPAGA